MNIENIRYKDCVGGRSSLVKDILEAIENLAIKYKVSSEDYHTVRMVVRRKSFILQNLWLAFIAKKLDKSFVKKINQDGEK